MKLLFQPMKLYRYSIVIVYHIFVSKDCNIKQGRKRPLDTPKRMIERERKGEGEI